MALFQFGSKLDSDKEYALDQVPLFSSLNPAERRDIQKHGRLEEYKRGDTVFEEGSPSDFFYIVITGKFKIFRKGRSGRHEEILNFFYRGDHFGESSLLTGQPHSVFAEAMRDGVLLKIPHDDFLKLIRQYPSVSIHLNRLLGYRLTRHANESGSREVKVMSFLPIQSTLQFAEFWFDLGSRLVQEVKRPVILLDFDGTSLPQISSGDLGRCLDFGREELIREDRINSAVIHHTLGFDYLRAVLGSEPVNVKRLTLLITLLSDRYPFILIRIPSRMNDPSWLALSKSDGVYLYQNAVPEGGVPLSLMMEKIQKDYGYGATEVRILVPAIKDKLAVSVDAESELPVYARIPDKALKADHYWSQIRFMARDFAGKLLGLALGSGAAHGLAHIGVLKVLEEYDIRPDMIAGASIGALIGGLWSAGYKSHEIEEIAKSLDKKTAFFRLVGFRDIDFFTKGFLKGDQIKKFLGQYLHDSLMEDLPIPLKIVAADLFTSEIVVLDTGNVVDAIRASISIPGIFNPVQHGKRTLIDGGVIDPLPIRVLGQYGVKKIIAVNVLAGAHDRRAADGAAQTVLSNLLKRDRPQPLWKRFFPRPAQGRMVTIFNVIMNTIQFMEFEIADAWSRQADVLIHPIVSNAHWAEFYSAEKFIRAGEEKTRERIDEIRKLLNE